MYTVEFVGEAAEAIGALPAAALPGLLELVDLLTLQPQGGEPYHRSDPDGNMRAHTFGPAGHGMLVAVVDDRARRVLILRVVWLG